MYATIADLIARYGTEYLASLTNSDPNDDVPDNAQLQIALDEAIAEIDMYIGKCYEVPLAVVPAAIKFKVLTLARYYLESGCECSEKSEKQYEKAIEWLHSLCCGDCPPDLGIPKKTCRADGIAYTTLDRVFTRESLRRYTEVGNGYYGRHRPERNYKR